MIFHRKKDGDAKRETEEKKIHNALFEARKEIIQRAISAFGTAAGDCNYIECVKQCGVIEALNGPEQDFFNGMTFHIAQDFKQAAARLSLIDKSSMYYSEAINCLAIDYSQLGEYQKLSKVLQDEQLQVNPITKMYYRVQCLSHADAPSISKMLEEVSQNKIDPITDEQFDGNDGELYFSICRIMAFALAGAGECIDRCLNYQLRFGKDAESVTTDNETTRMIQGYDKACAVLSLSKYIELIKKVIVLPEKDDDLSRVVFHDKPWPEKFEYFATAHYMNQIINCIIVLLHPKLHRSIEAYRCVEVILQIISHILPRAITMVVNEFFDVIAQAYKNGKPTAAQYFSYAMSQIIAGGSDEFGLREKISQVRGPDKYENDALVAERIYLTRNMSRKGHEALLEARRSYYQAEKAGPGPGDYSALSLQFFRVIEIEYNEKLIKPLAKQIDFSHMQGIINGMDKEDDNTEAFKRDYGGLQSVQMGKKAGLELGTIRTLLKHITSNSSKEYECAKYLHSVMTPLLSENGKIDVQNLMQTVIGYPNTAKFRQPGAHTEAVPFSVADESKKYVERWLPTIESWFAG